MCYINRAITFINYVYLMLMMILQERIEEESNRLLETSIDVQRVAGANVLVPQSVERNK